MNRSGLWRRFGWVTTLSLLAAAGGVVSECVADAVVTPFTVRRNARWVQASWNFDSPELVGSVWTAASDGLEFQGGSKGPFAAAAATYFLPSEGRLASVWGGGPYEGSLLQGKKYSDTRLVDVAFPVNTAELDENGGWATNQEVALVNLTEQRGNSKLVKGNTHLSFANEFSSFDWRLKGTSPAAVTGSGGFSVSSAGAPAFVLVPPNTPISSGDFGKASGGTGTIVSTFKDVTDPR